jgi:hypothetical protein
VDWKKRFWLEHTAEEIFAHNRILKRALGSLANMKKGCVNSCALPQDLLRGDGDSISFPVDNAFLGRMDLAEMEKIIGCPGFAFS